MARKSAITIGFLLLLILVSKPVWLGREQWHIGQRADDGVYLLTAKAIATGQGYRLLNLPGAPYAVKYPPLYPAYLSLAWFIRPDFPASARVAAILQALLLPAFLALLLAVLRRFDFSWRRTFLVAAITVVSMQMVSLTITLFSELLCLCLLLGAILAAERSAQPDTHERDEMWWALAAGLMAGLAYLARSAALPILGAAPLFFLMKKKPRSAMWFLLLVVPIAASWHIWTFTHGVAGDAANGGYLREYLHVIRANGFWSNFLTQLAWVSAGVAEEVTPGSIGFMAGLPLYHIAFAAAISGGIRIGRRCGWPLYLIFSALYCTMILFWWNTGEGVSRLLVPAWPALLAGIAEEAAHVATLFEKTVARSLSWSQKSPVWRGTPRWVLIGVGLLTVFRNDSITWKWAETAMADERRMRMQDESAFSWIAAHQTANTVVLAWKDTTSFLYTGVVASRGLFIALTPQTPLLKTFATSFASLPSNYSRALMLILRSDLGNEFGDRGMDPFKGVGESLAGSKLEFSSRDAFIYSFPIPR